VRPATPGVCTRCLLRQKFGGLRKKVIKVRAVIAHA
jgi:hypothetical protein